MSTTHNGCPLCGGPVSYRGTFRLECAGERTCPNYTKQVREVAPLRAAKWPHTNTCGMCLGLGYTNDAWGGGTTCCLSCHGLGRRT